MWTSKEKRRAYNAKHIQVYREQKTAWRARVISPVEQKLRDELKDIERKHRYILGRKLVNELTSAEKIIADRWEEIIDALIFLLPPSDAQPQKRRKTTNEISAI